MRKQFISMSLIACAIMTPHMRGASASIKRRIDRLVSHVIDIINPPKEDPSKKEAGDAPTMMEAFLAYHYAYLSSYRIVKEMLMWLEKPENVPLLDMLEREQELTKAPLDDLDRAAYHVFYHAHAGSYRVLQDFSRRVLQFEQQQDLADFIPVRFWHDCLTSSDIIKFIVTSGINTEGHSDLQPQISQHLLSANLSFLGNLDAPVSSGAHYYQRGESFTAHNLAPLMQKICAYYDFSTEGLEKMLLDKNGESSASKMRSVLQVFIPRRYVDGAVYLSQMLGIPFLDDLGFKGYKKVGGVGIQTQITPIINSIRAGTFMEHIKDHASKDERRIFYPTAMDKLQARIVLGSDVMLNPYSGVKIFRYDQLAPAQAQEKQRIIDDFCRTMFIDWLECILQKKPDGTCGVKQEALDHIKDTPLGKLVKDDKRVAELLEKLRAEAKLAAAEQAEFLKQKPRAKL